MITDSSAIRELLQGTLLETTHFLELEIPETSDVAFAIEIDLSNAMNAWTLMRGLLAETQRWPVISACWGTTGKGWAEDVLTADLFSRFYFQEESYSEVSPSAIISRANSVNLSEFLERQAETLREDLDPNLSYRSDGESSDFSYLDWYEPVNQTLALILLPTPKSWNSLAYLSWYGSTTVGSHTAIAFLRQWHQTYGSELVCHYGTMLQLKIDHKPSTLDEALELARQQISLAPCTTQLPGIPLRDHAQALLQLDRWFLHERP